ncbi:MAG: dTDP-4-dehydrorhamnose 3,5-epimerase family protein [Patescibacteria group bacterium]
MNMIEGVVIKKLNKNEDERGWLTEIFRQDEDNFSPVMSYVSLTKPGITRGPHEHVKQADRFVFTGPGDFLLYLWDKRENSGTKGENIKIKVGASNPTLVIVPPGVVHGYKCISNEGGMSINLPDKLYKGQGKIEEADEIRWEGKEDSPYKIV